MKRFESIGFIGGGRVTRFLLEGWQRANRLPEAVRVADPDTAVLTGLKKDFPGIVPVAAAEAAECELVVLAVHPPVMKDVMATIKPALMANATVLSLAPKVTAAAIAGALGARRIVRMIPNAPSAIGRGFNPVSYSAGVDPDDKAALQTLFDPWGEAPDAPETSLEAYAILSAMGPTYMWFQWQALRELAGTFGLGPAETDTALLKMIEGAAGCLLASGRDPATVMDMIPVKPLKDDEAHFVSAYRTKLAALYEKIKA